MRQSSLRPVVAHQPVISNSPPPAAFLPSRLSKIKLTFPESLRAGPPAVAVQSPFRNLSPHYTLQRWRLETIGGFRPVGIPVPLWGRTGDIADTPLATTMRRLPIRSVRLFTPLRAACARWPWFVPPPRPWSLPLPVRELRLSGPPRQDRWNRSPERGRQGPKLPGWG